MGGYQYLVRLALGRSPFEELDPAEPLATGHQQNTEGRRNDGQLYDEKGRPFSLETEARNAEMRKAQNSVLALVGVVEKHNAAEQRLAGDKQLMQEAIEKLLNEEHDTGEDLEVLAFDVGPLLLVLPRTLLQRLRIGLLDSNRPFFDLLLELLQPAQAGGFRGLITVLLPGTTALIVSSAVRSILTYAVGAALGEVQKAVIRSYFRSRTAANLCLVLARSLVLVQYAIEIALMPLDYYARSQQLGLAPAFPLLPSAGQVLSRQPDSLYQAAWSTVSIIPMFGAVSAATVLCTQVVLQHNADDLTPMNEEISKFRYPPHIEETQWDACLPEGSTWLNDPFGQTLYALYRIRTKGLRYCGWNIQPNDGPNALFPHADGSTIDGEKLTNPVYVQRHRSTALAYLPARFFAWHVDHLLLSLLMLPLSSLMQRIHATSYLQSSLPKTSSALMAMGRLYAPFGGGPFGQLWKTPTNSASWINAFSYASKIGLGLCLIATVEASMFACVYGATRNRGRRYFGWRKKKRVIRDVKTDDTHASS